MIDAETKQPIEGAGVFVMWKEDYAAPPGRGTAVVGAMEMLTDKDGYFKIPHKSFFAMPLGGEIYGPFIKIFKPGYGYFEHNESGMFYGGDNQLNFYPKGWKGLFEKPNAVVELTRLKTREERRKNVGHAEPDVEDFHKYKLYMNLVNEERIDLGLEPY